MKLKTKSFFTAIIVMLTSVIGRAQSAPEPAAQATEAQKTMKLLKIRKQILELQAEGVLVPSGCSDTLEVNSAIIQTLRQEGRATDGGASTSGLCYAQD